MIKTMNNFQIDEFCLFECILEKLVLYIQEQYDLELINSVEYKKVFDDIMFIQENLNSISSSNDIFLSLSKIRLLLIEILLFYGGPNIYDILNLLIIKPNLPDNYKSLLDYYNTHFKTLKVEFYESENDSNINFKLYTFNKKIKSSQLQLHSQFLQGVLSSHKHSSQHPQSKYFFV
jgi:hypothetical protein